MVKYSESLFLHFQQTLMGVLKWDKNFIVMDINSAAEKIFGYTREEAIGQNSLDIIIPKSAKKQVQDVWNDLVRSKKSNININENITKNGRKIICEWFNTPLIDKEGTVFAVASMVQDITERKRIEKELIDTREKLESQVSNRTARLLEVNKQLKKEIALQKQTEEKVQSVLKEHKSSRNAADNANSAKSSFLANMSHELRTPLNAILGFGQLLEIGQENLTKQQIEFLEHIKHASNHLLEMVNDILDLSKIEAGRYEIEKKSFNLGKMLSRLPMSVNSLAFKKSIELIVDINLDNEIIEADEVRLKQVLYNLLSNAIKFTDSKKRIGIKARTGENETVIEVWDQGRGLSKDDLEKIFDPFEQVGKSDQKGTGLGLAISRKLIELHEGTLDAEGRIGEGSRFTIRIPGVVPQSGKEIIQKIVDLPIIEKTVDGKVNILVVEDDLIHQMVTEETLKHLGYHVHCERSGSKGIEAALNEKFDLILMDIQMPELSGIETMKHIKKNINGEVPIVAMTAYAMKGDMERFKSEGFDGYIPKPVVIKKLKDTIEVLLR